ncbi:hypothetical protein MNB_SV-8-162 [hydrothermal vent metagenome]|uniref:Uncharacterized protein n=1 Tax=hydrothermal vent metagenome TaxID=652676 RepID=A0A1W1CAN8_9ZZZZ
MKHHKMITRLLLLFYILGAFASAMHIHKDVTGVHTDCKICLLSNAMHGGNVVAKPWVAIVLPNYELPLNFLHLSYVTPISKGFYAQAPPFSSIN